MEVFCRMPPIIARSFQFTPAETRQSIPFIFIRTIESQNQSEAQASYHEQISMDSLDSEQHFGPLTRITPVSTPQSKKSALLRMKLKFMRGCHQLRESEEENKHLKRVIEKAHDDANPIGQFDVDEDNEGNDDGSNVNMDLSHMIINELSTLVDTDPQQRRFSTELSEICYCIQTVSPAASRILREVLPLPSYQSIANEAQKESRSEVV
jgi:hypothetical protein